MMHNRRNIGKLGESIAADFLLTNQVLILTRNYHTPYGEIDLVGKRDARIIFFEVKTRTNTRYGYPEEAVTFSKLTRIMQSAMYYLEQECEGEVDWQVDVIAIQLNSHNEPVDILWYENAGQDG